MASLSLTAQRYRRVFLPSRGQGRDNSIRSAREYRGQGRDNTEDKTGVSQGACNIKIILLIKVYTSLAYRTLVLQLDEGEMARVVVLMWDYMPL